MRPKRTSSLALATVLAATFAAAPMAAAQDEGLNSIVVTGTRIDASEMQPTPNITLRVQADFVLFEVGFVTASLDQAERQRDLGRAYDALERIPFNLHRIRKRRSSWRIRWG